MLPTGTPAYRDLVLLAPGGQDAEEAAVAQNAHFAPKCTAFGENEQRERERERLETARFRVSAGGRRSQASAENRANPASSRRGVTVREDASMK